MAKLDMSLPKARDAVDSGPKVRFSWNMDMPGKCQRKDVREHSLPTIQGLSTNL